MDATTISQLEAWEASDSTSFTYSSRSTASILSMGLKVLEEDSDNDDICRGDQSFNAKQEAFLARVTAATSQMKRRLTEASVSETIDETIVDETIVDETIVDETIVDETIVDETIDEEADENDDDEGFNIATRQLHPPSYRNDDFFAESPYYDTFVSKEMHTVAIVTETMDDLAAKTETFATNGLELVAATRRLASSYRLDPKENDATPDELKSKRQALEPEVVEGLERLGDVLDEMASAQEHLCRFLKTCMVMSIKHIAEKDKEIISMRDEAQNETVEAEQFFMKYMHGGEDSWRESGDGGGSRHRRGNNMGMAVSRRRLSLGGVPKSESNTQSAVAQATRASRWKQDLAKIRTLQASAELKRYQLATRIVDSKYERNVGISKCADRVVSEMCSYFSHCSNLATGLIYPTTNMKEMCEKLQLEHKETHWGKREKVLKNTHTLARYSEIDADLYVKKISAMHPRLLKASDSEFDVKEESDQVWDLPATLASYTGHRRPTPKGVLAEGWLYKKTGSPLYRSSASWSRSWYLVRKDGVFTFESSSGDVSDSGSQRIHQNFQKVKVCDLQLCTVREVPETKDDPSTRFCFELITPSNYSERLVLQARGPHDYKMWLEAVRTGISYQLGFGEEIKEAKKPIRKRASIAERLSSMANFNVVAEKLERSSTCSEIKFTITERGRSLYRDSGGPHCNEFSEADDLSEDVRELMRKNPTCADCGEACPEWVSLNLGVLICLECSGVHRSLGVHISKVRSLTLDALNEQESGLLMSLGNDRVNQFWEKNVTADFDERKEDRENWIRRKYVSKDFIGTSVEFPQETKEDAASAKLYEASKRADVLGVVKAIVYGGNVNWKNLKEGNSTALDVCGADLQDQDDGKIDACKELLYQNGAEMKSIEIFRSPEKLNLFNLTTAFVDEIS